MPTNTILEQIATAARLREGPEGVAAFIRQLYRESPLATAEIARRLGWPVPVAAAVRGELAKAGLVDRTPGGSALAERGRALAEEELGLSLHGDLLCPTCAGRRIVVDAERWGPLLDRLESVHLHNPTVDTTLDQSHATPETALRRALAMLHEGALEGKKLLILGDDDLVSVAVGLLTSAGQGSGQVTVLDVDPRFLAHIAAAGREFGFNVETVEHNLREPLPERLRSSFDTVETDPPYTLPGLQLFLSRALEGLRPGAGRDVFLSFGPRDPESQRAMIESCVELGLAPFSITPDFNRYAGAATLGGSSQFIHLRTTAAAHPAFVGPYEGPLYTKDERPGTRLYRCTECGATYSVGPGGDFPTIEALKEQGCKRCGGRGFRAGRKG